MVYRRVARMVTDDQDELPPVPTVTERKFGSYLTMTMFALLFYMAASIVPLVFYVTHDEVKNWFYDLYFTVDDANGVNWIHAGSWNVAVAVAIANFLYCIGVAATAFGWKIFVVPGLASGTNAVRTTIDSLAFPILSTTILMLIGDFDLMALLLNFFLVHILYVVGGYITEKAAAKGQTFNSYYSLWIFALQTIPIVVYLSYLKDVSGTEVQSWVLLALQWAYWIISGYVLRSYVYSKTGENDSFMGFRNDNPEANTRRFENINLFISLLFTQVISWLLFSMAFTAGSWVDSVDSLNNVVRFNVTGISFPATTNSTEVTPLCNWAHITLPCHDVISAIVPR